MPEAVCPSKRMQKIEKTLGLFYISVATDLLIPRSVSFPKSRLCCLYQTSKDSSFTKQERTGTFCQKLHSLLYLYYIHVFESNSSRICSYWGLNPQMHDGEILFSTAKQLHSIELGL